MKFLVIWIKCWMVSTPLPGCPTCAVMHYEPVYEQEYRVFDSLDKAQDFKTHTDFSSECSSGSAKVYWLIDVEGISISSGSIPLEPRKSTQQPVGARRGR